MIYDFENKTIQVKIVYYGPAMSGKTTSLKYIFNYFRIPSKLESIENTVGRTLFFDFGVLQMNGIEWKLKFLMYSATGQDFYVSTRPTILKGVDGIIFVADSQMKNLEHNLRSWNELKTLFGIDFYNIPVVIALNKYDLGGDSKLSKDNFAKNIKSERFKKISLNETSAISGLGIIESFKQMICFLFPQLTIN